MNLEFQELLKRYKRGDVRALARLITLCENGASHSIEGFVEEKEHHVVGITGSPGAGKSSIIDELAPRYVDREERAAVVAIDPSSPFTHGAFLGDRVRMRKLSSKGVFIRSMASRGNAGGLAPAISSVLKLLSGFGFSKIFLETVGVGQAEVEVASVADTVILILSPGIGDEIQLFKAGVMEIADIYVVNKADLEESKKLRTLVEQTVKQEETKGWKRRIVETSCMERRGFEELEEAINEHLRYLKESGELSARRARRQRFALVSRFLQYVRETVEKVDVETLTLEELKKAICDDIISERKNTKDKNIC